MKSKPLNNGNQVPIRPTGKGAYFTCIEHVKYAFFVILERGWNRTKEWLTALKASDILIVESVYI